MRSRVVLVVPALALLLHTMAAPARAAEPGMGPLPKPDDFPTWSSVQQDVDGVQLRFTFLIPKVERPTRMPLLITAKRSVRDTDTPATVKVSLCSDWRCELREQIVVPVDGAPVIVDATSWPGLLVRIDGHWGEVACCNAEALGRVILSTRSPSRTQQISSDDPSVGVHAWRADVGGALTRWFAYANAVSAVIVADGDSLDVDDVNAFVDQGGLVSIPEDQAQRFGLDGAGRAVTGSLGALQDRVTLDERGTDLVIPWGTRVVARGAGAIVLRPLGATANEELAGVLSARPRLLDVPTPTDVEALTQVAGVALAARPSRAAAFALAVLAVFGVVVVVKRARRLGWQRAVVWSLGIGVGVAAALWLLEVATVPRELRTRVVMWTGPNAGRELGVDAVRPRGVATVEVRAPVPLLGVTSVGHAASFKQAITRSDSGRAARARIDSSMGVLGLWSRPAPRERAVELVGADVLNHLDVPLLAVLAQNGVRSHGAVPAGGRAVAAAFDDVTTGLYDDTLLAHLAVEERRLLQDMLVRCQTRTQGRTEPQPLCAVAVARLADGTLAGIEVAQ